MALAAAIERRPRRLPRIRVKPAVPLAAAALGASAALVLTPLGAGLLDYMREIASNTALPLLTNEWLPTYEHPPALALVVAFAVFATVLYRSHPKPRPLAHALVAVGFVLFALTAARQAVWLGPLAFYLVRELAPAVPWRVPRRLARGRRLLPGGAPLLWRLARSAWTDPRSPG